MRSAVYSCFQNRTILIKHILAVQNSDQDLAYVNQESKNAYLSWFKNLTQADQFLKLKI